MSKIPEIRIQYSWTLANATVRQSMADRGIEGEPPGSEEVMAKAKDYEDAWKVFEKKILEHLQESTGIKFRQNYIDVYVVPYLRAFSDPVSIGTHYIPDFAVDAITHELIHKLLVDNTSVDFQTCPDWEKLFGSDLNDHTRIHIAVHAIHKGIYLDCLKDSSRLERDIENCKKYNAVDYLAAWDYVEKHGYREIVEKIKEAYRKI